MLLDIVAFVTARLADRERLALACDAARWFSSMETHEPLPQPGVYAMLEERLPESDQPLVATVRSEDAAAHMAFNDPALALRDVEADSTVLDLYEVALREDEGSAGPDIRVLEDLVLRIAAKWRDHPDYVRSWATR